MRVPTFTLAVALALTAACGVDRHPGRSIGIERFPGVRDLFMFAERHREKHGLPALGLGIVRDGQIIGLGVAGERQVRSANWATLDDRFEVASCAKAVTATVAAILAEQGAVGWDTTVMEVFPEWSPSIVPAYKVVTLDMLLRHRSGVGQWMSTNERWAKWHHDHADANATEKRRLFTAKVLRDQPRYQPGTASYYTNDAYLVAGSMLERVSGRSWEHLVLSRLFEPVGLRSMRFGAPSSSSTTPFAWGHESGLFGRARSIQPDPDEYGDPPFGSPGGFLYSTVPDLLRFVDFHIQGASARPTLLGRQSFARLHTPHEDQRFALGWEVELKRDGRGSVLERSLYHGGFSGRARANMWFSPESRTGTVIVYNHGGDEVADAYSDIFYALLAEFGLWDRGYQAMP
ncbi:MAG TPA: serine hydrolase domain-containing protein [Vicinamibacteria bacterium]